MKSPLARPPLLTLLGEVLGWTLDRTADIPKSQRFTFGQRLNGLTLDALLLVQRAAVTGDRPQKAKHLGEVSVVLEQLNLLWQLVHDRGWIGQQHDRWSGFLGERLEAMVSVSAKPVAGSLVANSPMPVSTNPRVFIAA